MIPDRHNQHQSTQDLEADNRWRRFAHGESIATAKNDRVTTAKVETLAKLDLEGKPAEITDSTIAKLCDWLWSEFQTTPLDL